MSTQPALVKLKLKNSAKQTVKKAKIKDAIVNQIQTLPDYEKDLKYDVEIIEAVLQAVENKLHNSSNEDKQEFAINILTQLFNLNPDEVTIIEKSITYIYENKIIKKHRKFFSAIKKCGNFFFKYF